MYPLLKGLRIIDITTIILGPFATQILGDLGADVIKVETPDGDLNRATPPHGAPGIGAVFANNNRNKRSIALDLKTPEGKAVLHKLIGTADALVHNMRQDALDRLGFSWEVVHALNPKLIYCAALGYGSGGPYAGKPAYDDIIQGASGIAGLAQLRDGTPAYHPTVTADKVAALHVVYGVLAALLHRERTCGLGQKIEMPMLEAMTAFTLNEHLMGATFAEDGALGYHRTLSPNRKPFPTRDGFIALLPYTTEQWRRAMTALGREDLVGAAWFNDNVARSKRSDELYQFLAGALRERTSADWLGVFEALDIPCGPVNSLEGVLQDPHLQAVDFFKPNFSEPVPIRRSLRQAIQCSGLATEPDAPPPSIGEDTVPLLAELGYTQDAIAALIEKRIVRGS